MIQDGVILETMASRGQQGSLEVRPPNAARIFRSFAPRRTLQPAVYLSPSEFPHWTITPKALGLFPGGLLDATLDSTASDLARALRGPGVPGQHPGVVGQRARSQDLLGDRRDPPRDERDRADGDGRDEAR